MDLITIFSCPLCDYFQMNPGWCTRHSVEGLYKIVPLMRVECEPIYVGAQPVEDRHNHLARVPQEFS